MAEDGQLARIAGRSASSAEPTLADLLDPIALEERLRGARARRAEALARRSESGGAPRAPEPASSDPHEPPPAFLGRTPAAVSALRPTGAGVPILIFLAGLGLGGALVAVLALQALPARIAATPAPDFAPAAAVAPASAPVVEAAPPEIAAAPAAPPAASQAPETPPPAEARSLRDPSGLAEPTSEAPPPHVPALPPVLEAALAPAPPAAPPPAAKAADAPALPARVFINYPSSASAAAAQARDLLRAAGVAQVEIVPIRYAIARSNIRFYHDGDRQPAAALAPLVAAALAGEAPEARDFTDYATPAAPGNVEIYLAGNPSGSAARTPARSSRPARSAPSTPQASAAPFQMPGVIAPPSTQAEQVERILIERLTQGR